MTTYNSTPVAAGTPMAGPGLAGQLKAITSTVSVPSTFTTTDTAQMHDLPPSARVL